MLIELQRKKCGRSISLTPLIDIVFILLIFFILESDFLEQHEISVKLPENIETKAASAAGLTIEIIANGNLWVTGLNMTPVEFNDYLKIKKFPVTTPVLLITDTNTLLQVVIDSIDILQKHSLTKIQLKSQGHAI